jgi:hypothetical protein
LSVLLKSLLIEYLSSRFQHFACSSAQQRYTSSDPPRGSGTFLQGRKNHPNSDFFSEFRVGIGQEELLGFGHCQDLVGTNKHLLLLILQPYVHRYRCLFFECLNRVPAYVIAFESMNTRRPKFEVFRQTKLGQTLAAIGLRQVLPVQTNKSFMGSL